MKKNYYGLYINGEMVCIFPFNHEPTLDEFCLRAGVAMIPTGDYMILEITMNSENLGNVIEASQATIEV